MLSVYLNELWTVPSLRAYAMKVSDTTRWQNGANRLAKTRGVCNVHRADGRLQIFTSAAGKVSRRTVKCGEWTVNMGLTTTW